MTFGAVGVAFAVANTLQPEAGLLAVTVMGIVLANRSKLDTVSGKLRQQLRAMGTSTCYIMLMLLVTCVLFIFTVLLMKVKSKQH